MPPLAAYPQRMQTTFDRVPIGATFKMRGILYTKLAASCAEDVNRTGHAIMGEVKVECDVEQEPPPPPPQDTPEQRTLHYRYGNRSQAGRPGNSADSHK